MAAPIGPGDWVECVSNRGVYGAVTQLRVGAVYRVVAVGVTPPEDEFPNVPWVRLESAPLRPGKIGFRASLFRPIYRPKSDLIEALKQPAPAGVRELEDA
jgi:hypothetical protein